MIAAAIAAGAGAGLLLEWLTLRARLRALRNRRPVLPLIAGGFLARLAVLLGGTLLGQAAGLWSPTAFLLAALAAILLGEAYAFARIRRLGAAADSSAPK
jgi:hypothetical protein